MSYGRTCTCLSRCLTGVRSCFVGGHDLWEMSCRSACLQDDISCRMMCFTGRHVLQEDRSYFRICLIGENVFQADMSYRNTGWHILQDDFTNRKTCHTGGQVLLEDMPYWRPCIT